MLTNKMAAMQMMRGSQCKSLAVFTVDILGKKVNKKTALEQ
jgi:hypothetical protein